MGNKIKIVDQLDDLFQSLLDKVKEDKIALETKLEVFKEGVRWAAVQNKLPLEGEDKTDGGRLGKFKRGLRR